MRKARSAYATIFVAVLVIYSWKAARICSNIVSTGDRPSSWHEGNNALRPTQYLIKKPLHRNKRSEIDSSLFDIDVSNYKGPTRAFPNWTRPFPCLPTQGGLMSMKPSKYGLLFLRPYKAGSTTISGIVMRLAHRRAQRHMFDQKVRLQHPVSPRKTLFPASLPSDETSSSPKLFCDHRTNHGSAVSYQYALRDKGRSFLLSIIRNPTRRAISYFFYFGVTADGKEPTDANFRNYLHEKMSPNLFLEDLSVYPISGTDVRDLNYKGVVQDVLDEYDFIAILERFDESLVALKMILSLDFEDILYVRDRSEGSFSNGDQNRPCVYLLPRLVPLSPRIIWKLMPHRLFIISFCRISFLTPGMKEFFTSETWNEHIKGDILLYQAVHNSLDLTIDRLGRDEFQRQLAVFLKVNQRAQKKCAPRAIGMCSDGGDPIPIANRTCYIWSEGCSHACLDEIHTQDEFEV